MSYTNGILNHDDLHGQGQIGPRGLPGLPGPPGAQGVGFKLNSDGNYDMEQKKLTNVRNGDADKDDMLWSNYR